jgi:integrase
MKTVQPIRDERVIEELKQYFCKRSIRDYLFFCMGIYSGLRVSDLLSLKVGMVKGTHVKVREKKNTHDKQFIIHPSIRKELDRYIEGKEDQEYLFPSRQVKKNIKLHKHPIHRSTAYRMLNKAAKKYGLQDIGTHTLRKTWGYRLYRQNPENLALLMKMYGHSDPTYTLDYIGMTQDLMDAAIARLK